MEEINERFEKLGDIENYKQLNKDLESGKTFLIDYKNKRIECNQFGTPIIKYNREITGQKSYKFRLDKGLIKEVKYEPPLYLPNTSHLVGSSMLPRPLSIPFINQSEKSQKLIDTIKQGEFFSTPKNKSILEREKPMKDSKALPNYFCVKLGANSPKVRKHLIKIFDENIRNKKMEYNNDPKYYSNDSLIKGLTKYKNFFENNLTKNLLNGNKIPYTKQKDINDKFKIIKKIIKKEAWNKMHFKKKNLNYEAYINLYKIKEVGDKNNVLKRNLSCINSLELKNRNTDHSIGNEKNSAIIRKKHIKLNAIITPRDIESSSKLIRKKRKQKILYNSSAVFNNNKNNSKYSSFQDNFNKSSNKYGSTVTTYYNFKNESKTIDNNYYIYSPKVFRYFHKSLSDHIKKENNSKKTEEEDKDVNEDEKSNISAGDEIVNKRRIKNLDEIRKNFEHESKLMKGYQPPPETEEFNVEEMKMKPPRFISPMTVYKKEIEIFKKVNHLAYERELKKKMFDDKMLRKKLENKKIFERIKIKK